jgi:hypothetical protein
MGISIITLATTSTNDTGNSAVGCAWIPGTKSTAWDLEHVLTWAPTYADMR